jgi:hypothetical protein
LVGIQDGNVLQEINLENLLPFFLSGRKCGRGVGPDVDEGKDGAIF